MDVCADILYEKVVRERNDMMAHSTLPMTTTPCEFEKTSSDSHGSLTSHGSGEHRCIAAVLASWWTGSMKIGAYLSLWQEKRCGRMYIEDKATIPSRNGNRMRSCSGEWRQPVRGVIQLQHSIFNLCTQSSVHTVEYCRIPWNDNTSEFHDNASEEFRRIPKKTEAFRKRTDYH